MLSLVLLSATFLSLVNASDTPTIGILTQPSRTKGEFMIAASYVKWLEAGGAKSIPIPYDAPPALVEDLFGQINGLLLPGGASDVPQSVRYLLTLALQASTTGDFFPVWGTCLGFEYMVQVLSNSSSPSRPVLTDGFDAENISLPLLNVQQRNLYAEDHILDVVTNYNVTMNNHMMAVEPATFQKDPKLNELFEVTSTNVDRKGRPFVSTIESRHPETFPWYGVQYHPEKNAFEYATYPGTDIPYEAINHSFQAVDFSIALARVFVSLATQQHQQNNNTHAYTRADIYPFVNTFPVKKGLAFEESYIIPSATHWTVKPDVLAAMATKSRNTAAIEATKTMQY